MQDNNTDKTNPAETEGLDISEYIPGHDLKRKQPDARPENRTGREKRSGINLGKIAFFGFLGFFLLQVLVHERSGVNQQFAQRLEKYFRGRKTFRR